MSRVQRGYRCALNASVWPLTYLQSSVFLKVLETVGFCSARRDFRSRKDQQGHPVATFSSGSVFILSGKVHRLEFSYANHVQSTPSYSSRPLVQNNTNKRTALNACILQEDKGPSTRRDKRRGLLKTSVLATETQSCSFQSSPTQYYSLCLLLGILVCCLFVCL